MPPKKAKAIQEANDFIDKLRRGRHLNDGTDLENDMNAQDLDASLTELSAKLYAKTTHFIAELVQNADDDTYASGVDPSLTLAYRADGHLFVGCNETGFEEDNVRAICAVARSTKKNTGTGKGYIGEKGIGFKSVFKVADVVWISSGSFSFKFNRDDILGMVVPIKDQFPEQKLLNAKDTTKFCLHIQQDSDGKENDGSTNEADDLRTKVKEEMQELSAEMLLFLRKLRTINIIIADKDEKIEAKYKLSREDLRTEDSSTITRLLRTSSRGKKINEVEEVTVFQHTARDMPKEDDRKGITESEIVIAFPHPSDQPPPVKKSSKKRKHEDDDEPKKDNGPRSRLTYNFLPIRDFGFPFLLHADFILTANRLDIVESNDWNEKLKLETAELFTRCVACLNRSPILRFQWPQFMIPGHDAPDTTMEGFLKDLRKQLCRSNILESQAGDFRPPKELVIPRDGWKDESGRPLLDDAKHLSQYVSPKYPSGILNSLGVITQLPKDCVTWLKKMSIDNIHDKPATWHSLLAKAIIEQSIDVKRIKDMKIIPLQSGRWACGEEHLTTHFCDGEMIEIPQGINCAIVASDAAQDPIRKELFEKLQIKPITTAKVCEQVLRRHSAIGTRVQSDLDVQSLVDHLWYLFKTAPVNCDLSTVKMYTEDEQVASASSLYMDALEGFKMSEHFKSTEKIFEYVHPAYLDRADPSELPRWHEWLRHTLGVASLPRLSSQTGRLSPLFQYLIKDLPSEIWLTLLRDNWHWYFPGVVQPTPKTYGLGLQEVTCKDGSRLPLQEVYLATEAICGKSIPVEDLPFVDVPDPDHPDWKFLSALGLSVRPDLYMYLTILRRAASNESSNLGLAELNRIFRTIQELVTSDPTLVGQLKEALRRDALLPFGQGSEITWRNLKECRWHVPFGINNVASLESQFPSMKRLFADSLGVSDATTMDILKDVAVKANNINHLESLRLSILALSDHVKALSDEDEKTVNYMHQILDMDVFPVRLSANEIRLASFKDLDWFVADRDRLLQVFKGKVWLLDYEGDDLAKALSLFHYTNTTRYFLSNAITEVTETTGVPKQIRDVTKSLQSKADFFGMLVADSERSDVIDRMQNIHVYTVRDLTLRRYVTVQGREVYGKNEIGQANLDQQNGSLVLQIPDSSMTNSEMPWYTIAELLSANLKVPMNRKEALVFVLTLSGDRQIKDALERKGVWNKEYELDTREEHSGNANPTSRGGSANSRATKQPSSTPKASATPGLFMDDDEDDEEIEELDGKTKQPARSQKAGSAPKSGKSTKAGGGSGRRGAAQDGPPTYDESQESQIASQIVEAAVVFESGDIAIIEGGSTHISAADMLQPTFSPNLVTCSQQTRYLAELFTYKALVENFEIPQSSWTSPLAAKFTGMDLDINENSATFTITDANASRNMTAWLVNQNYEPAQEWSGKEITYHVQVKATEGKASEQFHLSNAEMGLARQCHERRGEEVYLLFRVWDVKSLSPKVVACVDLLEVVLGGKMGAAAWEGWAAKLA